jgi:FkbM family methyltransferase
MTLIFDIGFNKGEFADACFSQYPECKVIGVEANKDLFYDAPQRENLVVLNNLVAEADDSMVEFFVEFKQNGISTASKDFMKDSRFTRGSKYLTENSAEWCSVGSVPTITLDTLIKEYGVPDVIKIDVEGYEYNVVQGLTQKVGKICFECHEEEEDKLHSTVKHLKELGYTEFGLIGYFEEKDAFEKLTFSDKGDPYLVEPDSYFTWDELKEDVEKSFEPERRVNYGMFWCK